MSRLNALPARSASTSHRATMFSSFASLTTPKPAPPGPSEAIFSLLFGELERCARMIAGKPAMPTAAAVEVLTKSRRETCSLMGVDGKRIEGSRGTGRGYRGVDIDEVGRPSASSLKETTRH